MVEAHQAIKVVARRTGLSAHVIRIWEKRYGAVEPERSGTNRRLYSDEQIERLRLLRDVTQTGHSIGHVAKLPTDQLRGLARESHGTAEPTPSPPAAAQGKTDFLSECVAAVKSLDGRALEDTLKRAELELGSHGLLQRLVGPLAQTIGKLWREGTITAAHEHFATAVIRVFLSQAARPFGGTDNAPVLLVTTPAGQIHELGALLSAAAASNIGWHVTYLGASLPAAEIAGAARQKRARAVALSLVYPEDDSRLESELERLRDSLPQEVPILVGGRAMPAYRDALVKIGAIPLASLDELCAKLDDLRKPVKRLKR
jgi:MerR family transcriptional regulator, light-induced transcriptional regulator